MQNNVRGNVQGKYAQKDASKVNMYEIAQLSRASAAPAKSCAEMERTNRERVERKRKAETERKIACLIVLTFSK